MIDLIEEHQKHFLFNNETFHHIVFTGLNILMFVVLAYAGLKLIDKFIDKLTETIKKRNDNNLLVRFMPLLRKVTKICFVLVFGVFVLQIYGFSVSTLVTGIGVGGVVFGLAAQKTITNIFGSVSLIVDNAYKVGDYIVISSSIAGKDAEGYVEDISLRSTKIRNLDGTILNIPNGNISEGIVKNYSQMKKRLFRETVNLTYSTPVDKIEQAKLICIEALKSNDAILGNYSVEVSGLNAYSVDLQIIADMKPVGLAQLYKIRNDLFLYIFNKFNENGIEFAFPTQTVEIKQ